jgi:lysine 2,3-aminomutase
MEQCAQPVCSATDSEDPGPQPYLPGKKTYDEFPLTCLKAKGLKTTLNSAVRKNESCADRFRKEFFPEATLTEWNDWHWQLANRIQTLGQLEQIFSLHDDERQALAHTESALPMAVTPYYASLADRLHSADPIRKTFIPVAAEQVCSPGEAADPLNEDGQSPVQGIVHRYPDRVLFLVTQFCSTYCRYCTRSRVVGDCARGSHHVPLTRSDWETALEYIASKNQIRDVLLSGGDPLTLSDDQLEWLLIRLRKIPHVEIVRIGTKVPMVLPQRVTPSLVRTLRRFHPLWISIHCTHPKEITPESRGACERLADAGIPLGSQTVLLKGINDNSQTLADLYHRLMMIRVRPYYLYQCDPILGSAHFRTPVQTGMEIMRSLQGYTSGYAVPRFVIDAPGGGGKVPINPEYCAGWENGQVAMTNYEGNRYYYPDTAAAPNIQGEGA